MAGAGVGVEMGGGTGAGEEAGGGADTVVMGTAQNKAKCPVYESPLTKSNCAQKNGLDQHTNSYQSVWVEKGGLA